MVLRVRAPAQTERQALRTPQAWITLAWAAVVLVTLFRDGGSSTLGVTLGTCLPLLVVIAGAVLIATGRLAPPAATRAGWIAVAGLAGLSAAAFVSISWSVLPQSSWDDALRAVCAASALVCGLWLAGALQRPLATTCVLLTGIAIPAVLWALTARSFHSLVVPAGNSRLQEPLPYPNALGILCATCALAALWTATRRHPALRLLGGASLGLCLLALPLTTSRGSILALAAGLAVVLALDRAGSRPWQRSAQPRSSPSRSACTRARARASAASPLARRRRSRPARSCSSRASSRW